LCAGLNVGYFPVEGVGHDAFGVEAAAYCIGFHADADQIVTCKTFESFDPADSHISILRFLQEKFWRGGMWFLLRVFAIYVFLLW
jgi:hypothetical protein